MPRISTYKPEVARQGTEITTNQRNIENIFAILNRHYDMIKDLESSIAILGAPGTGITLDEAEEVALMMMDAE
jgi:hypothetical protein